MIQKTLPNLINLKMKETTTEKKTNVQNKAQDWDGYQVKATLDVFDIFLNDLDSSVDDVAKSSRRRWSWQVIR